MSRRILIPLLLAALMVPFAVAQDNPTQQPQPQGERSGERGGDRERRGNFGGGPEGFMNRIKERMGVTNDEEWKVIQAKLEPVMRKSFETRGAGMMFGGRGRGGDNQPQSELGRISRELNDLLEDKSSSEDQIKQKLASFREARDKSRTELASLQKELKEILMPRQEAALVTMGMLE